MGVMRPAGRTAQDVSQPHHVVLAGDLQIRMVRKGPAHAQRSRLVARRKGQLTTEASPARGPIENDDSERPDAASLTA
jgi:hypothetical protein